MSLAAGCPVTVSIWAGLIGLRGRYNSDNHAIMREGAVDFEFQKAAGVCSPLVPLSLPIGGGVSGISKVP